MQDAAAAKRHPLGAAWQSFCERLSQAGAAILRADLPTTPFDKAEGLRYLTRLLRVGLIQNLEAADPEFPRFFQPCDDITKYGGDDPDKVYLVAMVRGDREYRITGNRGSMHFFSIGSKAFLMEHGGTIRSTGELAEKDLSIGPAGELEIIVSCRQQAGNWLPMAPETNFLLLRQTYLDRRTESPGEFRIEQIGGPAAPAPLTEQYVTSALERTAQFVVGNAWKWGDWTLPLASGRNQMVVRDQDYFFKVGGDPLINYLWGYFDIQPDEAWVIDIPAPEAEFWSFTLYNWWQESFDYAHRSVAVNSHDAKRNADGTYTFVVAARDAGLGNWMDSAGHQVGFALIRSYALNREFEPRTRVVPLSEL